MSAAGIALPILALLLPCGSRAQPVVRDRHPTELAAYVGGGQWLPHRAPAGGFGHSGGRALVGLQLERAVGRTGWAVAASVARTAFPFGTTELRPANGWLYDVAATRRWATRNGLAFAFAGAGPGIVALDETRVAAGVRAGFGLGHRLGLRAEGRRQYLLGAKEPHAYTVTLGLHERW